MKIIHCVESYYPSIGGMQEVVKQLSERLVKLGHSVIVLTRFHTARDFETYNGVEVIQFKIIGNEITPTKEEDFRYQNYLLNLKCDVITFFAAQQWATNFALPILKNIKAKKISVPTGYSGLNWPEFEQYYREMKTNILNYDMNVYLSNDYRDINFARANKVQNITLIPNGAAQDEFEAESEISIRSELKLNSNAFIILHVGSYTGRKGHKEVLDIFLHSKVKNAVLLCVSNIKLDFARIFIKNPRLAILYLTNTFIGDKKIIFKNTNREFTVAAYKQSNLFLFPSNIECSPIVLFECAAAKLPFLATDVGNSFEIASWTMGGKILPTTFDANGFSHAKIKESVKLLNDFYLNEKERLQMAETAHKIWKEKYSWEKITLQYEQLYKSLISK